MTKLMGTYVHTRTGNKYHAQGTGEMKHPDTGDWVSCAFYAAVNRRGEVQPPLYCRELQDFLAKFESES